MIFVSIRAKALIQRGPYNSALKGGVRPTSILPAIIYSGLEGGVKQASILPAIIYSGLKAELRQLYITPP
jgi:hypothetical protein